jgi:hypothetical protein
VADESTLEDDMEDRIRRRFLLGWAVMLVSAGVAACDSPVAPRSMGGGPALVAMADTQAGAPAAAADSTTWFYEGCGTIYNNCPTTDSVTVAEPGGNVKIGTFGPKWTQPVTIGGDNYGFQLGVKNGSFIGIIWKNGTFVGYWGYCLFPNAWNDWYKTTDATGKVLIHWVNHELDSKGKKTGQRYEYVYDPATNTLKVYHRDKNGNTKLVYQGPPIKSHGKLPPPDPAGADPYTNENQWTTGVPVPPTPAGTTTAPATTTPETATPATGTPSTTTSSVISRTRHRSGGGGPMVTTP